MGDNLPTGGRRLLSWSGLGGGLLGGGLGLGGLGLLGGRLRGGLGLGQGHLGGIFDIVEERGGLHVGRDGNPDTTGLLLLLGGRGRHDCGDCVFIVCSIL